LLLSTSGDIGVGLKGKACILNVNEDLSPALCAMAQMDPLATLDINRAGRYFGICD
jgi:hypothetical protein